MILAVAYKSQLTARAKQFGANCIHTCYQMLYGYETGEEIDIARVIQAMPKSGGGLVSAQVLLDGALLLGVPLTQKKANGWRDIERWVMHGRRPVILVVSYRHIPHRQDKNYTGAHAVLAIGVEPERYIVVNDPDHLYNIGGVVKEDWQSPDIWHLPELNNAWFDTVQLGTQNGTMFVPGADAV